MDSEKVFDPDSLDRKSYQNVGLLFGPIIFILMMLFSDHQDVMSMIAWSCLLYTSPSPRDATLSRMPSSA